MPDNKDKTRMVKMLADVPLFAGLKNKQLKSIADSFARERSYNEGQVIEQEGGSAVAFYLITDGAVEVRKRQRKVAKLGKGQFFGEMALIDNQPRSATVIAMGTNTKALVMPSWSFKAAIKKDPQLAMGVMGELARRLRETTKSLSE